MKNFSDLQDDEIGVDLINSTFVQIYGKDSTKLRLRDAENLSCKNTKDDEALIQLKIKPPRIYFLNMLDSTLYLGLVGELIKTCKEMGIKIHFGEKIRNFLTASKEYDPSYIRNLKIYRRDKKKDEILEITPRDYQYEMADWCIKNKFGIGLLATGGGKTLTLYMMIRYIQNQNPDQKIVVVVPNVNLTKQGYSDFSEYSAGDDDWNVEDQVQRIGGGSKDPDRNIVFTTWQSLGKKRFAYFSKIDAIFVDEVHGADAKILKRITEKSIHAQYKIGMTGTLKGTAEGLDDVALLTLKGLFGGKHKVFATARMLMDWGYLPNLKVLRLRMKYSNILKLKFQKAIKDLLGDENKVFRNVRDKNLQMLNEEKEFVKSQPMRTTIICDTIEKIKGNTVVFFERKAYGKELKEHFESISDKKVFYVDGDISANARSEIYEEIEKTQDCVLFATFGTLKVGISIDNLDVGIMVENYKQRTMSFSQ